MRLEASFLCLSLAVAIALAACSSSDTNVANQPGVEQAVSDAIDGYIYGYPLVTMDMTRKFMTNYATFQGSRGPMGQLIKLRSYPAVDDHFWRGQVVLRRERIICDAKRGA